MAPYKSLEEYNLEITNDVKERYSKIIAEIGEDVSRKVLLKPQNVPQRQCCF